MVQNNNTDTLSPDTSPICEGNECIAIAVVAVIVLVLFIVAIVYDTIRRRKKAKKTAPKDPVLVAEYQGKSDSTEPKPTS